MKSRHATDEVVILLLDSRCVFLSLCLCICSKFHKVCTSCLFSSFLLSSPPFPLTHTLSPNFLLSSFSFYRNSFSPTVCIRLAVARFLVYLFCQRAVVWDIPVYTVIHYGLSSFIGALLSCKIAQGSFFFLAWNQFIADIYSGMTFSGFVFQRQTVYITSYWVVLPLL